MTAEMENPAARAGANRVLEVNTFCKAVDDRNPSEITAKSLAVRVMAGRFRLSVAHARTVCELAGIGGQS